MRTFISFSVVCFLALGCGRTVNSKNQASPAVNPLPATTPVPVNPGLNPPLQTWTTENMNAMINSCSGNRDSTFSSDQWQTFCSCVVYEAASRWNLQDFLQNYSARITTLTDDGTLMNCLQSAGMVSSANGN